MTTASFVAMSNPHPWEPPVDSFLTMLSCSSDIFALVLPVSVYLKDIISKGDFRAYKSEEVSSFMEVTSLMFRDMFYSMMGINSFSMFNVWVSNQ